MTTRHLLAATLAAALLAGAAASSLAQAVDEHHPEAEAAAEAAPQAPARPGAGPGMTGMGMGPGMMGPGMMAPGMMGMGPGMMGPGMMGPGMMGMGPGMMDPRTMGHGAMGHGMLRMMFILMDTDGDGALSLEEVQAAHARIFNAIDADNDGRVTLDELRAFMRGWEGPAQRMPMWQRGMPMQQGMPMDGSAAAQAYMEAMQTMMQGMAAMQMTGDPNRDFALMMIPHHQSALDMAEAFLQYGDDPQLTQLANEIISAQQEEIEFLQQWLGERR